MSRTIKYNDKIKVASWDQWDYGIVIEPVGYVYFKLKAVGPLVGEIFHITDISFVNHIEELLYF